MSLYIDEEISAALLRQKAAQGSWTTLPATPTEPPSVDSPSRQNGFTIE
jgi:hypothetical protein